MKKKIIYGLLLAVSIVTASSSFVSCKDYEGDDYAALIEKNASLEQYLNAQIQALQNAINACGTNCGTARTELENRLKEWVAAQNYLTAHQDLSDYAKRDWVLEQISANNTAFTSAVTTILANGGYLTTSQLATYGYLTQADLAGYLKSDDLDLTGYATKADIDNLRNYILLGDSVKNAYAWASYSYQRLLAQGDSLKTAYNQSMTNKDSIRILADSIDKVAAQALENFNIAKDLAESAKNLAQKALDSVNIVNARVNDLETAYKAADEKLQKQIDTLKTRMDVVEKKIDNILGTLKKQITGVIIQAAYSPVLGNGSLPLGIQTNVLAAYVGVNQTGRDVVFPSYIGGDYANGVAALTGEDYDYLQSLGLWPEEVTIASGDYILSDDADNAGKLYVTVNPTNIDFEGTDFNLVNSKGEKAKVELSPLKSSDEVLKFGWTRAGVETPSASGFYEVNAKIAKENVADMQPAVNSKKFEQAMKETLVSDASRGLIKYVAVMDLARAVYGSLEPLQRFGVQATWQDPVAGTRSYTSALDVAATVLSPLGYGFTIPESKYTKLPIFNVESIKERLHLKEVTVVKVVGGKIIATGTATDELGNTVTVNVDVTDLYEELYGNFNTSYSATISQANKRIDYFVNFINRYNRYATKVNNAIANANSILQPVLLWTDGENAGELGGFTSTNYTFGTQVKAGGAIGIVPTSYTLELLAPAFKKNVVVTNVYMQDPSTGVQVSAQGAGNRNGMEDALKEINAAINSTKLIDDLSINNPFVIDVKSEYVGMTFEFTYTAVDYTGQIAGRKFYMTVVE